MILWYFRLLLTEVSSSCPSCPSMFNENLKACFFFLQHVLMTVRVYDILVTLHIQPLFDSGSLVWNLGPTPVDNPVGRLHEKMD